MVIKSLPKHKRPREKLELLGSDNLSFQELLAIFIRTGSVVKTSSGKKSLSALDLATQISKKFSLQELMHIKSAELTKIPGIGKTKAVTLEAIFEICRRTADTKFEVAKVENTKDALNLVSYLATLKKEHLVVLYLNAKNHLILKETISVGVVDASLIHPREVFEPAIRCLASAMILVHNHPSGDHTPSQADKTITEQLLQVAHMLGIDILDHLIISSEGYFSFREAGLLDFLHSS
jgi:DNA repair protein RadC